MRKFFLSAWMISLHLFLYSQHTAIISGKVTDKQTGEVLPGATIILKDKTVSVIADHEGYFKIQRQTTGKVFLIISFVGYETAEITLDSSEEQITTANITLAPDSKIGNEIVISASKRPEKITNAPASIQIIGKKDIEQFAGSSVIELLSKIQGIEYTRNGVTDITFNARGFHSAFNNKVLQLVDGRISTAAISGNLPVTSRGTLVKDDIERMEIILGPQSGLYGPNALNAVFNTITKDPRKYEGTTVSMSAGNRSLFSSRIRHANKINSKWAYKLTGEYSAGEEYKFYDSVYLFFSLPSSPAVPERISDFGFRHIRG